MVAYPASVLYDRDGTWRGFTGRNRPGPAVPVPPCELTVHYEGTDRDANGRPCPPEFALSCACGWTAQWLYGVEVTVAAARGHDPSFDAGEVDAAVYRERDRQAREWELWEQRRANKGKVE